jgi:DNA-binding response OmpR family regulator
MRGSVLIVEDDQDISQIVGEVLSDEGFVISKLADAHPIVIRAEVGRLEPDVVCWTVGTRLVMAPPG